MGNGGPSPSATYDYLTVANMTVPTVEQLHLALHIYTSEPSSGQSPNPLLQEVVYMDLQVRLRAACLMLHQTRLLTELSCADRAVRDG